MSEQVTYTGAARVTMDNLRTVKTWLSPEPVPVPYPDLVRDVLRRQAAMHEAALRGVLLSVGFHPCSPLRPPRWSAPSPSPAPPAS